MRWCGIMFMHSPSPLASPHLVCWVYARFLSHSLKVVYYLLQVVASPDDLLLSKHRITVFCFERSLILSMTSRIPPHLARELRRHIKNPEKLTSRSSPQDETSQKYGILLTFTGVITFLGITSSIPYFVTKWIGPLNERDNVCNCFTQLEITDLVPMIVFYLRAHRWSLCSRFFTALDTLANTSRCIQ